MNIDRLKQNKNLDLLIMHSWESFFNLLFGWAKALL